MAVLDKYDLKILETLQVKGRMTNKELADVVSLSPSACHQRLQKLIEERWLEGFMGHVNIERLCAPVQCISTLTLANHSPDAFGVLERYVVELPQALEAFTVSGGCDFVIRFACRHMSEYMAITDDLIKECPGISNVSTHVIMRQSKLFQGYPIKALL